MSEFFLDLLREAEWKQLDDDFRRRVAFGLGIPPEILESQTREAFVAVRAIVEHYDDIRFF